MTTPEREDALPVITPETGENGPDENIPEPEPPKYYISFRRLEELKRSPLVLVAARRVADCPSMMTPIEELTDPQALVDEIAEYHETDGDFIKTDMPLMEIVFRILLSTKNQPTSLLDLHYELTERWATPIRPINISEEGLQKILDGDNYYGFGKWGEE